MSSSQAAPAQPYSYVGQELELFASATNWKSYFRSALRDVLVGDVLEVGAGIGETTRRLVDGRQSSWLCLEPDPRLAAKLTEWAKSSALPIKPTVQVGTASDLGASPRFDAVLYIDVLEHIDDDRGEMARAASVLKQGGHLIVLSPAFPQLFSEFDRSVGHYRRYTRRTLAAVMPRTVRCRQLYYLDCVGFLASLANRMMLRQGMPTPGQVAFWDRVMIPLSRILDPVFRRWFGRSVLGVYQRT
jgi:SAM-dependent methyltransferase